YQALAFDPAEQATLAEGRLDKTELDIGTSWHAFGNRLARLAAGPVIHVDPHHRAAFEHQQRARRQPAEVRDAGEHQITTDPLGRELFDAQRLRHLGQLDIGE